MYDEGRLGSENTYDTKRRDRLRKVVDDLGGTNKREKRISFHTKTCVPTHA